jgi:hypothetical protein
MALPDLPQDDPKVERAYTMAGIMRRLHVYGPHPHCDGCSDIDKCGISADPLTGTIVECAKRPGPLFADYEKRRGL